MNNFSKSSRLQNKSEYDFVFQNAKKIYDSKFTVLYRHGCNTTPRLGLIIGKKNIAKAWQRNRLKRIIRESFRQYATAKVDIVFIAKKGAETYDNQTIFLSLGLIWSKLDAVCNI